MRVEHHAGMPGLMKPLRGQSREAPAFGPRGQAHLVQWHTTDGTPSLVAAGALDRAQTRQKLWGTRRTWSTRVPATWREAPAALAQADPPTLAPRLDG